jgi:hypothetical protein
MAPRPFLPLACTVLPCCCFCCAAVGRFFCWRDSASLFIASGPQKKRRCTCRGGTGGMPASEPQGGHRRSSEHGLQQKVQAPSKLSGGVSILVCVADDATKPRTLRRSG